ncbi:MAG: hypothetical protein SFY56_01795 [Bacteroidota bacterium]|nr:hypothetical protein [Bacteroidota bacterium]
MKSIKTFACLFLFITNIYGQKMELYSDASRSKITNSFTGNENELYFRCYLNSELENKTTDRQLSFEVKYYSTNESEAKTLNSIFIDPVNLAKGTSEKKPFAKAVKQGFTDITFGDLKQVLELNGSPSGKYKVIAILTYVNQSGEDETISKGTFEANFAGASSEKVDELVESYKNGYNSPVIKDQALINRIASYAKNHYSGYDIIFVSPRRQDLENNGQKRHIKAEITYSKNGTCEKDLVIIDENTSNNSVISFKPQAVPSGIPCEIIEKIRNVK